MVVAVLLLPLPGGGGAEPARPASASPLDPHSNEVHGMSVNGAVEVAAAPAWRG